MFIRLFRKNPALATGITLPIVMVLLFSVAALIPRLLVEPPHYGLLFSMKSYSPDGEYDYRFTVENNALKWEMRRLPASKGEGGYNYRLYWYDPANKFVHELPLETSRYVGTSWVTLPLKETEQWKISPELVAPDGYRLHNDYKRTSDLGLILFSGSQRNAIHIAKNSRIISIYPPKTSRAINIPEFIGWIESTGESQ